MSSASVVVRYDGPALAQHRMEVSDLAPALLGVSELCKIANRRFNGERATLQVFIGADQEQRCFQFSIELVQTLWQHAQAVMGHEQGKTAEDILKIVGLIGSTAYGFLKLYALLKGKKVDKTTFETINGKDVVKIEVHGNNNTIYAQRESYEMLKDAGAEAQAKRIVQPVTRPGYARLEFESPDKKHTEVITPEEAEVIVGDGERDEPPQVMDAWVKVYSPVYDPTAQQWQFKFLDRHAYMDISQTDIATKAVERGGALADDTYKVRLEIQQSITPTGQIRARYRILEVLEFHPAQIGNQEDWIRPPKPAP